MRPTILTSFAEPYGEWPSGGVTLVGLTFYGSCYVGGAYQAQGTGSIFSLATSGGVPNVLASFSTTATATGANPLGTVVVSGSTIYCIAQDGGTYGAGGVISLPVTGGTPTLLYSFPTSGGSLIGPFNVQGNLVLSGTTLYGTATLNGANKVGMVFAMSTDGTQFNDMFDFNSSNGYMPCGFILNGSTLYGATVSGGAYGDGTIYSLNVLAATVKLTNPLAATIITGGTATLGATVANSALPGCNNLNYTLTGAFQSGSGTLVGSGAGSLAPSASQSCTVAVTSTNLGSNTITLTAYDSNSTNLSQSASATLTVLDHAAATATVTSGNGFLLHAGAAGLASATITLNNASGTRSALQVNSAPGIGSGTLSGGAATPYYLSAGSAQTYTASFNVGNTPGVFSDPVTFPVLGDNQSLSGCNPLGTLTVAVTGNVFSGNGVWSSSGGSLWSANGNWSDANAAGVHAAPGTFSGYKNTDSAAFSGAGSVTAISLSGARPASMP